MALEAQCTYLAEVSKNIDLKNQILTKSERFTARTGFDLYPSTLKEPMPWLWLWLWLPGDLEASLMEFFFIRKYLDFFQTIDPKKA